MMDIIDYDISIEKELLKKIPKEYHEVVSTTFFLARQKVELRQEIMQCASCPLHQSCTQRVPGVGPLSADIMMVGESPGEQEDLQGKPFVGPAGQLLNKALEAIGWNRNDVYITNVLKCRPPNNRTPLVSEVASCYRHLQKEIELVKPKVIICVGAVAANTLIHPDFRITQEHGVWFENRGIRMIAIYHPSYLLRLGEGTPQQVQAKWEVFHALEKVKAYQASGFDPIFFQ